MPPWSTASTIPNNTRMALINQLEQVSQRCTQCQKCVSECSFLQHHGDPKNLADSYDPDLNNTHQIPFECHLCELCAAVCPHSLNPAQMFLEMRREAFERGQANLPQHKGLRNYEKIGTSKHFSWYALPQGCDSIFFPGCALSGSRASVTLEVYKYLQKQIPTVGIVLDCCSKPSHDLGHTNHFTNQFDEMKSYLRQQGIRNILVACPNCQRMFNEYAQEFITRTVYELIEECPFPEETKDRGNIVIHDPCVSRFYRSTQDSVRSLIRKKGFNIIEPLHVREKTFCCGEGAGVKSLSPEKSNQWKTKRLEESSGERMVSYCAACSATFSEQTQCHHLLDLLFDSDNALKGESAVAKAPITYFNRLRLKQKLRNQAAKSTLTRERTVLPRHNKNRQLIKKLALLTLLTLALFGFKHS